MKSLTFSRFLMVALVLGSLASASLTGARRRGATFRPIPTFSDQIVRIFQEHCQSCHRPGGVAPMSLLSYEDAKPYAWQINHMTQTGQMPPWKPAPGCGEFNDERRLSQGDLGLIARWVEAGAPEGDRSKLPQPLNFDTDWKLGPPDETLTASATWVAPAHRDSFRIFVLPEEFTADRFVSSVDFRPLANQTVHHMIAYIDTSGEAERLDALEPEPGYESSGGPGFTPAGLLGGWFPGALPFVLPEGIAVKVPAGARVVLQVHYHPHHGVVEPDRPQVALYFAESAPSKLLQYGAIETRDFTIPAGDPDFRLSGTLSFPQDVTIHTIGAHMHYLGKRMTVSLRMPDGSVQCLLDVPDWDPKWQGMYQYKIPQRIPAGATLELEASYDNSAANPRNPNNPPADIVWGEEATNEMCIAYLTYTVDED